MNDFSPRPRPQPSVRNHYRSTELIPQARSRVRPHSTHVEPSTNVFINYIPTDFTEDDLKNLCSQYGTIVRSKIMINLETGQSKCFGFVRFENLTQAQAAIRGLNGMQIGQKQLLAKYAQSKEKQEQVSSTVYIKRLPKELTLDALQSIFNRYGKIVQITPHAFDIDQHSWRCIIKYTNSQSATQAIIKMNNQIVLTSTKPIHVRYADESKMSYSMIHNKFNSVSLDFQDDSQFLPSCEMQLLPRFLLD